MTHSFLTYFSNEQNELQDYLRCMRKVQKILPEKNCRKILGRLCPMRFGKSTSKSQYCYDHFRNTNSTDIKFSVFQKCRKNAKQKLAKCTLPLERKCDDKKIVATKTARVSMVVVKKLLERLPNLKVIHYMRDPRSLTLSRLKHPSFQGIYAGNIKAIEVKNSLYRPSIKRIAQTYCQDVLNDLIVREDLQSQYPGVFIELFFEELAVFPTLTAKRVYDFLGVSLPDSVRHWLGNNTRDAGDHRTSRDSIDIVMRWRNHITPREIKDVETVCKSVMKRVKIDWK